MHRLCECYKNRRDPKLVIGQVLYDVSVEAQDAKFVCTHHTREQLHHDNLVVEREALVIAIEEVIELLGKGLRIVKELEGGKIGR